jgi:hypothetical protein
MIFIAPCRVGGVHPTKKGPRAERAKVKMSNRPERSQLRRTNPMAIQGPSVERAPHAVFPGLFRRWRAVHALHGPSNEAKSSRRTKPIPCAERSQFPATNEANSLR